MGENHEIINAHCHILNHKLVPERIRKKKAFLRETLLGKGFTRTTRQITSILPGNKFDRLDEMLSIFREDDLSTVAETLIGEMDKAGITSAVILTMDLWKVSGDVKPSMQFEKQILFISELATRYPGRLLPFVMFDPRREDALDLVRYALDERGFFGVKVYPPLGYHPVPDSEPNSRQTAEALKDFYEYCSVNKIPVATHCSDGISYKIAKFFWGERRARRLCHPQGWKKVLENYNDLRINFGHFGDDDQLVRINRQSSWSHEILSLMRMYENVYADLSYHERPLSSKTDGKYFRTVTGLMDDSSIRERVLFGTDWPMTRHTWREKDYIAPFRKTRNLGENEFRAIALDNPRKFLFPEGSIPQRILSFYQTSGVDASELPAWMQ